MKFKIFMASMVLGSVAFSAIAPQSKVSTQNSLKPNAYEQSLYEQLAGKPGSQKNKVTASAAKALNLARQSRSEKNYILAIKRYNFILKYYSKSPQAKVALMDKVSMYKEMGLNDPYVYNQKKVSAMNRAVVKPAAKATVKSTIKR